MYVHINACSTLSFPSLFSGAFTGGLPRKTHTTVTTGEVQLISHLSRTWPLAWVSGLLGLTTFPSRQDMQSKSLGLNSISQLDASPALASSTAPVSLCHPTVTNSLALVQETTTRAAAQILAQGLWKTSTFRAHKSQKYLAWKLCTF